MQMQLRIDEADRLYQITENSRRKAKKVEEKMANMEQNRLNEVESRREFQKLRSDEAERRLKMEKQMRLVKNVRLLEKHQ
jgi:hypothetical protein